MFNDVVVYGIVHEVQSNEPLMVNSRTYISVIVNVSPIIKEEKTNLLRLLINSDIYNLYYSSLKTGDKIVAKGYIKNRYFGNNSKAKKIETNIIIREIIKAEYFTKKITN